MTEPERGKPGLRDPERRDPVQRKPERDPGRPPALVLALHGTVRPEGPELAARLRTAVASALPAIDVRVGWADLLAPSVADVLAGLGRSVVVPCFLTAGYHVTADLPAAVRAFGDRARLSALIGPLLLDAVAARLVEAGGPGDAVVLAAAGSRRASSNDQVARTAAQLARAVGRPVVPAFVTAAAPTPAEAVARLRAAGHRRVTIATYLLAPGVFAERLCGAGADAVSAPIGDHPCTVQAVVRRYLETAPALAASPIAESAIA